MNGYGWAATSGKYLDDIWAALPLNSLNNVTNQLGQFVGDTYNGAKSLWKDEFVAVDVTFIHEGAEWFISKFTGWGAFGRGVAPKGGRYGDVRSGNVGGQVHHTPASAVSPYTHHTGPSVWMETADHRRTASWGSSADAIAFRQRQADLIANGKLREAVQMNIDDLRSKFGNKYDDHIAEMLEQFGDEF